ncbi:hypothetical protein NEMBOFW57_008492 [Staphylotrichum longicolle]|uniref:Tyrosinase copper-binding domain-containing protein n=1 Tax=Staphylotrichum longicolle TaxID=669026 RepID=A0AAD4HWP1_9PEZI|nr:hypothetical protein NEMBOFW57_008492 [Staphylotrichum longicolle]
MLALSEFKALDETDELSYFGITVRIAAEYPPDLQPEYVAAAQTLRQPYWDWASDPTLPPALYTVNVTVRAPCGILEIPNPLRGYEFKRPAYDIFARTKTFDSSGWRVSSFEFPHNIVHALSVCNGTFSDLNWSAFDPIFNVDRLVAMWQVIHNEEAIFTVTGYSTGQYATLVNSTVGADSPLKPFFDENLNFHTSKTVANITRFGYTYPEMPNWAMPPEARAGHVRAQVNSLYSKGANSLGQMLSFSTASRSKARHYYTAEIVVDRSEMPLPSIMRLVVGGTVVGRMALLGMPQEGVATISLPLQEVPIGNQSMKDLPPARVVLFLQENLTIEIGKRQA